jgi:hypothetical protein
MSGGVSDVYPDIGFTTNRIGDEDVVGEVRLRVRKTFVEERPQRSRVAFCVPPARASGIAGKYTRVAIGIQSWRAWRAMSAIRDNGIPCSRRY